MGRGIVDRLVVVIKSKSGSCYQVLLNEDQENIILQLIKQLHNGEVRVAKNKLPLRIENNKNHE